MDEREAKLLAEEIYKAMRPGFQAIVVSVMRLGHQLQADSQSQKYPDLEYQRQADLALLAAEGFCSR